VLNLTTQKNWRKVFMPALFEILKELFSFDRAISLLGFGLTLWQLYKTRTAADAAREAANRAVTAVNRFEAATKMQDIASRSRELLRLLRSKTLSPAASAAFELRDSVARFRHNNQSKQVVDEILWAKTISDVRIVHERLESLAILSKSSTEDREALLHEVGRLHTVFTELAAGAAVHGANDADSHQL
jgi:hypothetical protein